MGWKYEGKETVWFGLEYGRISGEDEVLTALGSMDRGVMILDGVSGCGKTRLLRRLREERGQTVCIRSYRDITEELVNLCRKFDGQIMERMGALLCAQPVLAVEDLDYLRGLVNTQQMLGAMLARASERTLIILTGNDLETTVPQLLRSMKGARHLRCLLTGSPEEEMLAIGAILPEGGMDRRLLEEVLEPHHWQAMYSLIRRGLLSESLSLQIRLKEEYAECHRRCPVACEAFLEDLWEWQEENDDEDDLRQIRDCFRRASAVLEDWSGLIASRAEELRRKCSASAEKRV